MNSLDISGSSKLISLEFKIKQDKNAVISDIVNLFKILENNNSVTIKQSQQVIYLLMLNYLLHQYNPYFLKFGLLIEIL